MDIVSGMEDKVRVSAFHSWICCTEKMCGLALRLTRARDRRSRETEALIRNHAVGNDVGHRRDRKSAEKAASHSFGFGSLFGGHPSQRRFRSPSASFPSLRCVPCQFYCMVPAHSIHRQPP